MLQQRKVDPGVLPKHLARTACRSTFPGPLVDSLKLCSVHVASCAWSRRVQPYLACMQHTVGFDLVNVCVSDDADPVPRRQNNRICTGHEDLWSC